MAIFHSVVSGTPVNFTKTVTDLDADSFSRSAAATVIRYGSGGGKGVFQCSDYATHNACVQAAVDYAFANGGGYVYIQPGFYQFSDQVDVKETVNIQGFGRGTYITWAGAATGQPANDYTGKYLFLLRNFTGIRNCYLHGNRNGNIIGGSAIKVGGSRLWISENMIFQFKEDGIFFELTDTVKAHANKIESLWMLDITGVAIRMGDNSYDTEFLNIWIGQCGNGIVANAGQLMFSNLHIWECEGDAAVFNNPNVQISNGYFESNKGWGVVSTSESLLMSNCRVWLNAYDNASPKGGIKLVGAKWFVLSNSWVHENNGPGLFITGGTSQWKVIGTNFHDPRPTKTQTYGVQVDSATNGGANDYGAVVCCTALPSGHLNGGTAMANHGTNLKVSASWGFPAGV